VPSYSPRRAILDAIGQDADIAAVKGHCRFLPGGSCVVSRYSVVWRIAVTGMSGILAKRAVEGFALWHAYGAARTNTQKEK
jgi:hypothetical protein